MSVHSACLLSAMFKLNISLSKAYDHDVVQNTEQARKRTLAIVRINENLHETVPPITALLPTKRKERRFAHVLKKVTGWSTIKTQTQMPTNQA